MKIALFGATGMIGQRVLREAVGRGHDVSAIARDPSKVVADARVRPVRADVLDAASVASAVAGHDAVVSAFSPRGEQGVGAVLTATRSLIAGLRSAGVKRLVIVGGAGSLETGNGARVVDAPDFYVPWRPIALAHADALDVYRAEAVGLDWTYFSPAALIEPGERTGRFRLGGDQLMTDANGNSRISAEDYAVALVDELETPAHVGRRFTIAY